MSRPETLKSGLKDLPMDDRDFSRTAVFGAISPLALPKGDFLVSMTIDVKDQGESDMCTAFATTAASEDQEAVILDPYFAFYATKVLELKDPDSWGADLRSACKAHVDHGCLEEEYAPFNASGISRDMVLDPKVWTEDHMALAYEHRKNSFFNVLKGSPLDTFDTIRGALWQNRNKMASVVTGARWRGEWTDAAGGVIEDKEYGEGGTPHAFVLKGQKIIDGTPRLVAQLSNGTEIGDKGIFYFPRSVVNKEFTFGCFSFEDMPRTVAENHLYYGTTVADSALTRWAKIMWRIFTDNIKGV